MTTDLAVRRPIPVLRRDWDARSPSSGRYAVQRVVGELVEGYRQRHAQRFAYEGGTILFRSARGLVGSAQQLRIENNLDCFHMSILLHSMLHSILHTMFPG